MTESHFDPIDRFVSTAETGLPELKVQPGFEWFPIAVRINTWMESFDDFSFDSNTQEYADVCVYSTEQVLDAAFRAARMTIGAGNDPTQWLEAARIVAQDQYDFEDERINVVGRRCADFRNEWEAVK